MILKKLSDAELVSELKNLVRIENQTTHQIIEYLEEVERRKIYLRQGFSSLFTYCTESLGYSESAAQRRISAMRLTKELPIVKEKLTQGTVNLSTLSQLQYAVKRQEKATQTRLPTIVKLELLEQIENKSQRDTEKTLAAKLPDSAPVKETLRPINSEEYELKFTISKELHDKLQRLRELLAHQSPNPSHSELLEILTDMTLKKLDPLAQKSVSKGTSAVAVETRYVRKELKIKIWKRDQGMCTYQDHQTGRRCGSRFGLELDHRYPYSLGGEHSEKNLRLLCKRHNNFAWEEVSQVSN